ncbi:uncharacterized protein LOC121256461 isoform X2 [Juglans microcarpa x Juglans regia]|uniref:uncharacterized protein LOC121256461 isoform X2 n=1 Tax=Juglans microcarpa x Juglans regia TaxID=2249226 RepID=UPI001B7F16AA|nr:uncharacterized protein LOC121256461 isoform X2 [Juglans microcarpa x Juglans regia]
MQRKKTSSIKSPSSRYKQSPIRLSLLPQISPQISSSNLQLVSSASRELLCLRPTFVKVSPLLCSVMIISQGDSTLNAEMEPEMYMTRVEIARAHVY